MTPSSSMDPHWQAGKLKEDAGVELESVLIIIIIIISIIIIMLADAESR